MYNIEPLIRRHVVTIDPERKEKCCGIERDEDGFCQHRPGHPVYLESVTIGVIPNDHESA